MLWKMNGWARFRTRRHDHDPCGRGERGVVTVDALAAVHPLHRLQNDRVKFTRTYVERRRFLERRESHALGEFTTWGQIV